MSENDRIVLIVDDDPQFGKLVATVAQKCGLRPRVATSGRDVWQSMEEPPVLILLDLNMPDADGLDVLRELAFRGFAGEVRVLSGSDSKILRSAVQIGRDLGLQMGETLAKPLAVERMRNVFAEAMSAAPRGRAPRRDGGTQVPELSSDDLRRGIVGGQLFVAFQPILNLANLEPVGAEALVRWRHPEHGVIPPGLFVPLAESSGLVVEMTEQVFHQALEFTSRREFSWHGQPLAISVNLATASLVERGLAELISSLLASSGIASSRLTVEVTETAMRTDRTNVLEVLSRLRLRGVQLSIDDFGTGTSSLERVDQMPCTELKIERAFIADVLRRTEAAAIVRSTLDLARRLELGVVAEGIEDVQTLTWLRAERCPTGQGFLFSRGLEAADFIRWLQEWPLRRAGLLTAMSS